MNPPHGRPYTPTLGDWEGVAYGMGISFRLVYKPIDRALHDAPYGYEDLVLVRHGFNAEQPGCPSVYGGTSEEVAAEGIVSPISASGIFDSPDFFAKGGLTGPRSAVFTAQEVPAAGVYAGACKRVLSWHLHPARRRPVADGSWKLRFANGESESFTVIAGGRVASGIGLPSVPSECGEPFGGVELFIGADGSASFVNPEDGMSVNMTFDGAGAKGKMAFGASSSCEVGLTASLATPSH